MWEIIRFPSIISEISASHGLVDYAPFMASFEIKPMKLTRTIYNRHLHGYGASKPKGCPDISSNFPHQKLLFFGDLSMTPAAFWSQTQPWCSQRWPPVAAMNSAPMRLGWIGKKATVGFLLARPTKCPWQVWFCLQVSQKWCKCKYNCSRLYTKHGRIDGVHCGRWMSVENKGWHIKITLYITI